MAQPRARAASARLHDGRILVTGGAQSGYGDAKSAEIFDPATGSWSALPPMAHARSLQRMTTLEDGRVLVTGGWGTSGRAAEIFDPASGSWKLAAPMLGSHVMHTSTLLPDGRVLVAGGHGGYGSSGGLPSCYETTNFAETYDPQTDRWTAAAPMRVARSLHAAAILGDGRVLISGGSKGGWQYAQSTTEIYDPGMDRWTFGPQMSLPRLGHTATTLRDGTVLVVGGCCLANPAVQSPASMTAPPEVFDASSYRWTPTGAMEQDRYLHTTTMLANGSLVVVGGLMTGDGGLVGRTIAEATEVYDAPTRTWRTAARQPRARFLHVAEPLGDNRLMIAGGSVLDADSLNPSVDSSERFELL